MDGELTSYTPFSRNKILTLTLIGWREASYCYRTCYEGLSYGVGRRNGKDEKRMMMMKQREQKVYDPVIDIDDECFAFVVP